MSKLKKKRHVMFDFVEEFLPHAAENSHMQPFESRLILSIMALVGAVGLLYWIAARG